MSFIICNSQRDQSAVNYTTYFRNEVEVPRNAKIGVYTCQINITPDMEINDENNTLAVMWDYQFQGEDPALNPYPKLNVKRYLPNDVVLRNGVYSVDTLSNEIYWALTWGDKCGLHQYVVEPQRDSADKFTGFKISVNLLNQIQNTTVKDNMNSMVVKKLHTAGVDQTITHPTDNTIKIEKTGGVDGDYDSLYQLGGAMVRDGSSIIFKPHIYTNGHYMGLSRNISYNDGEALKYLPSFNGDELPEELDLARLFNIDGDLEAFGAFCDYAVLLINSEIHLFTAQTLQGVVQMVELEYWETGLADVGAIKTITGNDPEIKFEIINETVKVSVKDTLDADFVTINRGSDWKGISSATMSLYPLVANEATNDYIIIDSTQAGSGVCFLEPQGSANSAGQAMNLFNDPVKELFVGTHYHSLIDLGWDYCVSKDQFNELNVHEVLVVEENVFLALQARERKANVTGWNTVANYLGGLNEEDKWVAGSAQYSTNKLFYPYLFTSNQYQTPTSTVFVNWEGNSAMGNLLNIGNKVLSTDWLGTYPTNYVVSDDTPKSINSNNAYVRINNLPIQTYNGTNNSISRIIGIVPRFNAHRSIGHIYTLHNPPVYIKLNNVEPLVISQLSLSLVNDDETLCQDISGNTQIMFHLIN